MTESVQSELNWIERVADGDADAMREVIEAHKKMVFGTCLRILGNSADAEDAAQATFILFYKKSSKIKSGTILGGWLYHTAAYVARHHKRSLMRRKHREGEASMIDQNEFSEQEIESVWNELSPELDDAIGGLSQKYRDVVVLRYLQGKSTSETANQLGVSPSTVTTNLARAIDKLRLSFKRKGIALSTATLSSAVASKASAAVVPETLESSALAAAMASSAVITSSAATATAGELIVESILVKLSWFKAQIAAVIAVVFGASAWAIIGLSPHQIDVLNLIADETEQVDTLMQNFRERYLAIEKEHTTYLLEEENEVELEIAPFKDQLAALKTDFWGELDALVSERQRRLARHYVIPRNLFPFGGSRIKVKIAFDGEKYTAEHTRRYGEGANEMRSSSNSGFMDPLYERFWGQRERNSSSLFNKRRVVYGPRCVEPLVFENEQPKLTDLFVDILIANPKQVDAINTILKNAHLDYLEVEKKNMDKVSVTNNPDGSFSVEIKPFKRARKKLESQLWDQLERVLDERQFRIMQSELKSELNQNPDGLFSWGDAHYSIEITKETYPGEVSIPHKYFIEQISYKYGLDGASGNRGGSYFHLPAAYKRLFGQYFDD